MTYFFRAIRLICQPKAPKRSRLSEARDRLCKLTDNNHLDYSIVLGPALATTSMPGFRGLTVRQCSSLLEHCINETLAKRVYRSIELYPDLIPVSQFFINSDGYIGDPSVHVAEWCAVLGAAYHLADDLKDTYRGQTIEALIFKFEAITESLLLIGDTIIHRHHK